MFACSVVEGILSVVVMAACECVVLLFESVMLFNVLYSLLELVLWLSLLTKVCQFCAFCSWILLFICVLRACICSAIFCVRGSGEECLRVSRCLMRP